MSQHTPGPWMADLEDAEQGEDISITAPDPSGVYVATVTTCWPCAEEWEDGEHQDEGEANARLIAAAPDLLAACKMLVEGDAHQDPQKLYAAWRDIRAAVAKAEGGDE